MNVFHWHEPPETLLASLVAALGEVHPAVVALKDVFARFGETERRVRDLEVRLDEMASRLDRAAR